MKDGFLVKIIPPAGYSVYRLRFTRRHIIMLASLLALILMTAAGLHTYQLHAASEDITRLQLQREEQQRKLDAMQAQTQTLQKQNSESQRAIEAIQRALGADGKGPANARKPGDHAARTSPSADAGVLQAALHRLARASEQTREETSHLQQLAARVLNMRRVASIARERMIAAIPSLNPVNGTISAGFGYRTNPFPEFHKGLDLAADYGTTVRAAAAGTVASAGWDGGYGIKVDIDHGNGYHTWYCHLSRTSVNAGQRVTKGEPIAAVGSTGESTGPHLHFQMMQNGVAIDPQPYLTGVPQKIMATLPDGAGVQ
ncbi:MAG: M23 family metallopeptidase [Candidatus Velthaea sp.]